MRVRNVTIGIKSVQEGAADFLQIVNAIKRGHPPKRKKEGVFFVSLEAMRRVLTPKRIELLKIIREKHPRSVYELARLAKREIKNVQDDVDLLSRIELITLSRAPGAKARLVPRVDYDNLQLQIPLHPAVHPHPPGAHAP